MSNCKLHPLVRLINLDEMNTSDLTQCFVVILQGRESHVCTGTTACDFRDATLLFFRPGECGDYVERMKDAEGVRALCFCGEWLGCWIDAWQRKYKFFEYQIKESLHLSLREKAVMDKCLDDINEELEWGIDEYSNVLIAQKIRMLFDYACRFYDRQHITRSCLNACMMKKMEQAVDAYLVSGKNCLTCCHVPARSFAPQLGVSEAYLLDFLRRDTGKTLDKYVCARHFVVAKRLLLHSGETLLSIAHKLGYASEESFSSTFKRVLGCSPSEYQKAN